MKGLMVMFWNVYTTSFVDAWVLDSGAAYHMTYNRGLFDSFQDWNETIKMNDDWISSIKGSGTKQITIQEVWTES